MSGNDRAEPRDPGIQHHQIGKLDADAAETDGETRRLALRQHQRGAGLREPRGQAAGAHLIEHGQRRHVERMLQRLADRDRALEGEIEILRRIGAVAHRPVVDQRLRVDEAVLEAQSIDERLERRAGRTQRLRHVDLAGAALVEIVGRADMGRDFAGRIVDDKDSERDVGTERLRQRADALARQLFQISLQVGVDA